MKLLRNYHDASQYFLKESDATIENRMFPCRDPQKVICHNDFAPFTSPENADGFGNIKEQITRGRLFLDAYGLPSDERDELTDIIIERLQTLLYFLITSATQGNKKYQLNMEHGHHNLYSIDIDYILAHKSIIPKGLKGKMDSD